jgi:hypothetical protein
VYDALGKEVAVWVNEKLFPGSDEAVFNESNYPRGIYFKSLKP